jgi:hypothetical protein
VFVWLFYTTIILQFLKCGSNIVKLDIKLDIKWIKIKITIKIIIEVAIKVFIANITNSI